MSYCLNPKCSDPENLANSERCRCCSSQLLLRDRYYIIKALARGGFGATFLARDKSLPGEFRCVVKQLRPSVSTPKVLQMARELFVREAKTLRKICNHPQVPRILDFFEDSQQFYLVQEYISGLTLQQEVKGFGPFSEAGIEQFLSEFLPMLQEIHDQKVIHRDIKPANLIRRAEDRKLILIDFGAVKDQVTQSVTNFLEGQTAFTAFAVGTRGFAPPEQIALRPVYASDIYALGVTCIYLLSGKSPQELDYNPSTGELLWQDQVQVSDFLRKVLQKMLEASVRHRYQSATEVLKALELEPYLDSLAKGMTTQPSHEAPKSPSDSFCAPSVMRMAEQIRARQTRLTEANSEQMGMSETFIKTTILKNSGFMGQKPKVTRKLDSHGLLTAYANGKRNFAELDLSSIDLQQANLSTAKFCSAKLDKTNFQKANLFSTDLSRASLKRTNLREANLSKADLNHADLEGADLRNANFSDADLNNANLRGANLSGANLSGAKVSDQQLASAKMNWMTVRPNSKRGLM